MSEETDKFVIRRLEGLVEGPPDSLHLAIDGLAMPFKGLYSSSRAGELVGDDDFSITDYMIILGGEWNRAYEKPIFSLSRNLELEIRDRLRKNVDILHLYDDGTDYSVLEQDGFRKIFPK